MSPDSPFHFKLRHFHFQLTPRCNLHCTFCGQNRGMLASRRMEIPPEKWLELAREAAELAAPDSAEITLWGGEPLLYPDFDRLVEALAEIPGVRLQLITNGTLIHRHAEVIRRHIDSIFISVEGDRELTDSVRGSGTYDAIAANIRLLTPRRGTVALMAVVSDANVERMTEIPRMLACLQPDSVILSQLMYLSGDEVRSYRDYSAGHFGCDYCQLAQWQRDDDAGYLAKLRIGAEALKHEDYPFPVVFTPHFYPWQQEEQPPCRAPWTRLHIRNDGECGFCTDYFGFSAGNALRKKLREIFRSAEADAFREAVSSHALPICRHCPWRGQEL
ncbi:MAG: radical SAM protein [Victivallales bacterium]|nr:radical SAM protein [Victivallales bacterium]